MPNKPRAKNDPFTSHAQINVTENKVSFQKESLAQSSILQSPLSTNKT